MSQTDRQKPGASFAFKPRNNIASGDKPDFSNSQRPSSNSLARKFAPSGGNINRKPNNTTTAALRDIGTMVNERVAPKASEAGSQRQKSPDDDDDIFAAMERRGFGSIKASALHGVDTSDFSRPTAHPTFGHPTKMMSSRKQKADIFIHQKNRPEHHLGGTKVSGPRPPAYQDRKQPPLPVFDSNFPSQTKPQSKPQQRSTYSDEIFYTDPTKANEDLKALLEGGMEDEDDEDTPEDAPRLGEPQLLESQEQSSQAEPPPTAPKAKKTPSPVGKDGTVAGLKVKLLPHQVEGVQWMRGRELGPIKRGRVPKGGLLADDMGLGKTLQSVSLILTNCKPEKDSPGWKKQYEKIEKTTLVVAPLALIRQWEHEMKDKVERSQGLKVLVHHGPQRTKNFKDMALYDVVVTTYQILVSEHGNSSEKEDGPKVGCFGLHWWRVILDEAHTIKNRNAKASKACYALRSEYRWCLSGTPMQNNLDELQSLVRFLRISPYDDLRQWKDHIDKPMKNGKGHIAIKRLHTLLRCFMKRRTKEILKQDGALNPGGKPTAEGEVSSTGFKHTERKVVTVAAKLPPAERQFYDRLEARADQRMEAMMREKLSYANAFTLLLRLRQACNHPKLVEGKLEKDKDAMSTDSSQKTQDGDLDAMADMFAGMGIAAKNCSICGKDLTNDDVTLSRENCAECHDDLEYFAAHEQQTKPKTSRRKKKTSKKTKAKTKTQKDKRQEDEEQPTQRARRPRNRNAIVDSDDGEEEEEEGSWLVPEAERDGLNLGKAGGEEDENAEGGGDTIGPDDSDDDVGDDKDQGNLSSFVVDDETARKEDGYRSVDEASDDGDSLASVSALTKAMESQTLEDTQPKKASASDSASDAASASDSESDESESGIDESELHSSSDEEDGNEWHRSAAAGKQVLASAKIRELSKILHAEAHEHKFIVFSQFTSMLDLVEPFLRKDGFKFVRYDGSMKNENREESLRRLREDQSTRILLCSLKCGSLGLNLTAATRVIIVEPFWNPFVEEQAIDRVHRLTQTIDVVVYKLTVSDTVEERILDLQNKKRELAEQAIEGGAKKEALKLGLNEIIDLFKPGGHHGTRDGAGSGSGYVESRPGPLDDRRRKPQIGGSASGGLLRRKMPREESATFGRRW